MAARSRRQACTQARAPSPSSTHTSDQRSSATLTNASAPRPPQTGNPIGLTRSALASLNAVLRNKPAMLVWGLCIVALTAVGFATGYLAFVVIMPWLAFSAWHAYRQTIDAASWDDLKLSGD